LSDVRRSSGKDREKEREREIENRSRAGIEAPRTRRQREREREREKGRGGSCASFSVSFSRAVSFSQPAISAHHQKTSLLPTPVAQPPPLTQLLSIFLSFASFQRLSPSPISHLLFPGLCSALYSFRARNHRERKTPSRSPKKRTTRPAVATQ
jgi:hypothetical protein